MNETEVQPGLDSPQSTDAGGAGRVTPIPPPAPPSELQPSRPAAAAPVANPPVEFVFDSATIPGGEASEGLSDLEIARRAEQAGAIVMAARIALRRGQKEAARDKLKEAFAINPVDAGALEMLGDIFMEEGEQDKAIRVYERGRQFQPEHAAFEEKIGLAHIDLDEMQRDRARRDALLAGEDPDKFMELKPGRALGLSLIVPGAGQIYNGDNARAALFMGTAFFLFFLWVIPLFIGGRNTDPMKALSPTQVLANWPGWGVAIFWLLFLGWISTYPLAAWDAWQGAERANEGRRYGVGVEV